MITGVLKQSLRRKYFEKFLEESNNNQIEISISKKECLTKYDPDVIQEYFCKETEIDYEAEVVKLPSQKTKIDHDFLMQSLWIGQALAVPTLREQRIAKVQLHRFGDVPDSFKMKVGAPRVRGSEQSILAKSCQDIFSRRALSQSRLGFGISRDTSTVDKKKQTAPA